MMYLKKVILPFVLFLLVFFISLGVKGQLVISDGGNAINLVQNVLLGAGVSASNITYTGAALAKGSFTTGGTPTNLGITSGVILSTGKPSIAMGPNNATSAGFNNNTPGDALLTTLANQDTFDASILEFDFVPQGDTIKFRYVFGSEEYPEFVTSLMNDIFGFFLTGLNPVTYNIDTNKNIALVPGTTNVVVSIGTINNIIPSYPQFYVNNTNGTYVQYDGFTTVLTAWALVVPCTAYHIKLAIADGGDHIYDSGVFLEEGSFSSAGIQTSITYSNNNPGLPANTAIEGCADAIMTFKLGAISTTGYMIPYTILDNSTATYGIDYDSIESPLLIPIGSDSASIVIHPHLDNITEGAEWVGIIVPTNICLTQFDTVYFYIADYHTPQSQITATPGFTVPCGDTVHLLTNVTGGIGPFTYSWTNGPPDSVNAVSPTMTTLYHVNVTDICNYSVSDSATVHIFGPTAIAGSDTAICLNGQANLTASGGTSYHWSNGANAASIQVSPSVTTSYIVTVTATCSDIDTVIVAVHALPVIAIIPTQDSICPGTSTQLLASGGTSYAWSSVPIDPTLSSQSSLASPIVSPGVQTVYTVTVTDDNTCQNNKSVPIVIRPIPTADFIIDFHSICVGANTLIHYNGTGSPSATYLWDFGGGLAAGTGMGPYSTHWDDPGYHTVSLKLIQNGCPGPTSLDSVSVIPVPQAEFVADVTKGCPPLEVNFTNMTQNATSSAIYEWYFGNGDKTFINDPFYIFKHSGFYNITLVVTNAYGCSDSLVKPAFIQAYPIPTAVMAIHPKQVSIFDPVVKFNDLSLGNPVAWIWDFGDGEVGNFAEMTHTYADTGDFIVSLLVQNSFGCTDTVFNKVKVNPDNTLYVPNAFTPNGDGHNNIFKAYGVNISDFQMMIFSRWGEMVFSAKTIDEGWDGTYKGSLVAPDVYSVIIYYHDALGAIHSFYNQVILIR
ncbi:MAG: choice-of-anchor L domain-containing protein [Bacteroidota bacterium]